MGGSVRRFVMGAAVGLAVLLVASGCGRSPKPVPVLPAPVTPSLAPVPAKEINLYVETQLLNAGYKPIRADCPDLKGEVGTIIFCRVLTETGNVSVQVIATGKDGGTVAYSMSIVK